MLSHDHKDDCMRTLLVSLGLILLLNAAKAQPANNYTQTPEQWLGGNVHALVKVWGEPDMKIISPHGNKIYIYKTKVYPGYIAPPVASPEIGVTGPRPAIVVQPQPNLNTITPGPESLYCNTEFEVNKANKIVNVKVKGVGCAK